MFLVSPIRLSDVRAAVAALDESFFRVRFDRPGPKRGTSTAKATFAILLDIRSDNEKTRALDLQRIERLMRALWRTGTLPLLLLLSICGSFPLHAADWLPVTTEELRLTSEPKAPGAAAIYLYRQVDRDDTESEESHYVRLKILKEEGRSYADVEITYTKDTESIRGIDARTIRPDGSIVKFDGTVYDKAVVSGRGVKVMAKTFTMPEAGVGSIIEYRFRREQSAAYVFDSHWILSQELFTKYAKYSLFPNRNFSLR